MRLQDGQVGQIAVHVAVVQPVADDEGVGDVEADEVRLHGHLAAVRLPQQDRRADARRAQVVDLRQQLPKRVARVENVVDQQHVAAANVGRQQIEVDHQRAGPRAPVAIAAGLHQIHAQRHVQPPDQVGEKHDAADQHADNRQRASLIVPADFIGQPLDALAKLFLGEQSFHGEFSESLWSKGAKSPVL